jgi:hypothetical protein
MASSDVNSHDSHLYVLQRCWWQRACSQFSEQCWSASALRPSGHLVYRQLNINQFYVLPTQCIYVFCVDLRTNSDYFTVQHWLVAFRRSLQSVNKHFWRQRLSTSLSVCYKLSVTKPSARFLWHPIWEFFTNWCPDSVSVLHIGRGAQLQVC